MQQRVNDKTAKVVQKRDSQPTAQMRKKAEEADALTHDYDPLESITSRIGDSVSAAKHASVIQRTGLFHPMNEGQRARSLLRLQGQYGNRFVQRVLAQHAVQTKLMISQPGDIYEQEADRIAEQIMQMPEPKAQRQLEEEEEEELLQTKSKSPLTPLWQRGELRLSTLEDGVREVSPELEARINAMRGEGQPLPASARAFFEPRFGYDFSQVRVHTDAEADTLSRALNAHALTLGKDIFLGQGAYNLGNLSSQKILAHELTHVVQQVRQIPESQVQRQPSAAEKEGRKAEKEGGAAREILNSAAMKFGEAMLKEAVPEAEYVIITGKLVIAVSQGLAEGLRKIREDLRTRYEEEQNLLPITEENIQKLKKVTNHYSTAIRELKQGLPDILTEILLSLGKAAGKILAGKVIKKVLEKPLQNLTNAIVDFVDGKLTGNELMQFPSPDQGGLVDKIVKPTLEDIGLAFDKALVGYAIKKGMARTEVEIREWLKEQDMETERAEKVAAETAAANMRLEDVGDDVEQKIEEIKMLNGWGDMAKKYAERFSLAYDKFFNLKDQYEGKGLFDKIRRGLGIFSEEEKVLTTTMWLKLCDAENALRFLQRHIFPRLDIRRPEHYIKLRYDRCFATDWQVLGRERDRIPAFTDVLN